MNQTKTTAQDFFLNVGVMATLYVSVASFLGLFFSVIDKIFPDAISYDYDAYSSGVRLSMASLIIVFPLFLWISRAVTKIIVADAARREMGVRKWLIYITMFLASSALVIDLITLLNYFLSGEISIRFILKVAAVLVIAGMIFWYYLAEVRGTSPEARYKAISLTGAILVLALLVTAFSVFGSPANTRRSRMDDQRVWDLQSIQAQVINYWQQKGKIPTDLAALNDPISSFLMPNDPQSGLPYTYERTGSRSFKLCAMFELGNKGTDASVSAGRKGMITLSDNWQHASGQYCFDRIIDDSLYPVRTGAPAVSQ